MTVYRARTYVYVYVYACMCMCMCMCTYRSIYSPTMSPGNGTAKRSNIAAGPSARIGRPGGRAAARQIYRGAQMQQRPVCDIDYGAGWSNGLNERQGEECAVK